MLDVKAKCQTYSVFRPAFTRRFRTHSSLVSFAILIIVTALLSGCGITYNSLPLTVNPGSLSFGAVPVGKTQTAAITLQNSGLIAVTLNGVQASDPAFQIANSQAQTTLQPGATATLSVSFTPSAAKSYSSQVAFTSGGKQTMLPVSGSGEQGTTPPAPPATAALQVSTTAIQFGNVPIGGDAQSSVTLTSSGTGALQINSLNSNSNAFSVQAPSLPVTLQPGQALNVPVKFGPTAGGAATGQLVILSNAAASPSVSVSLAGDGTNSSPAPPSTPPGSGTPVLSVSSNTVNFGSVAVGSEGSNAVTLSSTGSAAVVVQSMAVSGEGFAVGQLQFPLTLAPGQQISVPITFSPSSVGTDQGQITLTDNAAGSPGTIALDGTGTAAAGLSAPTDVEFGNVTVGSEADKSVTLTSSGTTPVTVSSVTVAGVSFSGPSIVLPQVLAPSQQMSLKLKFSPKQQGDAAGTVTILSDAASNSTIVLQVHGKGTPSTTSSLSASATSLSFGQVPLNSQAVETLTVTSTGTAPASITAGSITGTGFTAAYAGVPIQSLASPITLQPGQQIAISVAFDPSKQGKSNGQLSLSTDTGSPVAVSLSGDGIRGASPALTMSAASLSFGDVQLNSKSVQQLTLTSSGSGPVTISNAQISGQDFQVTSVAFPTGVSGWPATLNPGQQIVLSITFAPAAVGSLTGDLALTTNASGGTANVPLSGTGDAVPVSTLTLSANSISFGSVQMGSKASRTLTLSSTGTAPLNINSLAMSNAQFSAAALSLPMTLNPGQQVSVDLTFDPTAAGAATGALTVTSNDASGPAIVSLGGTGTNATAPQISVNPTAINFGNVPMNSPSTQPVTITSTGTAPLTISAANLTGAGFSDSGATFPMTLNPSQSVTLQLQFDPASTGASTGQLSFASNSSTNSTLNIPLNGTGTTTAAPQLTASVSSLAFGNVAVNGSATLPLTLTSTGTAPLTISAATLTGAAFSDSGATFPLTLNPSQSVTLQVQFAPGTSGSITGQLSIASNSSTNSTLNIPLSGTGTAAAVPQLTVSATSLSFGNVTVNGTATLPLTLTSTGTAPLTISTATLTGAEFSDSVATFPMTLNPSQSVTLQVKFNPATVGSATGQVSIASNSSTNGTLNIPLSGTGTAATSPQLTVSATSLPFGNVAVNGTATLPLTLTSTGTAPLTISTATLTGAEFSDSGATFPMTLNPSQSVTLQVEFNPGSAGSVTGQLTLNSNSASGGTTQVQLSGSGTVATTPQLLFSTTSLSFGNVQVGSTGTLSLSLTSSGTAPVTISAASLSGAAFSDSGATFPMTLNPNQSATLQVQFDPTAAGTFTGQLTVNSNSTTGGITQVSLSGTGTAVQHSVDLSWDAPSSSADPATGYNVYRSTDGGATFAKLNASPDAQVDYTDSSVQSGSTYVYQVTSVDSSGVESSPSNQVSLSVP